MMTSTTNYPHDSMASRERPKQRRATDPNMGRSIFVFCDGPGKDGRDPEQDSQKPTNVYRVYRMIERASTETTTGRPVGPDDRFYLPFYVAGVGAGSAFRNPGMLLNRSSKAAIVNLIAAAYLRISETYKTGDDIYLFGCSSGAFVMRKVASLIYRFGLESQDRETLIKRWSRHEKPAPWNAPDCTRVGECIRIKCLVAWDTIGAVFTRTCTQAVDLFGIPDTELPPNVDNAFHALAFHENRRFFRAKLFKPNPNSNLKEVWFPGAHDEVVGGGTSDANLPNISLLWVLGEIDGLLSIPNHEITSPDVSTIVPTDAYHRASPIWRLVDRCETRLQSGLLKNDSLIHETVAYISLRFLPRKSWCIISIHDMSTVNWDVKAYLVASNTLERMKRSAAMTKKTVQEQVRGRVSSLRNFDSCTPRLFNTPPSPTSFGEPSTPRTEESSTFIPRTSQSHEAQAPPAPTTSIISRHRTKLTYSRQRVDSNAHRQRLDSPVSNHHIRLDVPPPMAQWSQLDTSHGESGNVAAPSGPPSADRTRKTSSRPAMRLIAFCKRVWAKRWRRARKVVEEENIL